LVLRAMAGGAVPVVSRLPQYEELLRDGELGLLFEPPAAPPLAAQLERLLREPDLLSGFATAIHAARPDIDWSRAADQFEELYERIAARRHDADGAPAARQQLASPRAHH